MNALLNVPLGPGIEFNVIVSAMGAVATISVGGSVGIAVGSVAVTVPVGVSVGSVVTTVSVDARVVTS